MAPEIWCATNAKTDIQKLVRHLKIIHTFRKLLPTTRDTFSDFKSNNTDTCMELLPNNTTHFSRQQTILNFQRVPSKLNYGKNFFQSTYHTIMALLESYYKTILNYSELKSNFHTFTELLPQPSSPQKDISSQEI